MAPPLDVPAPGPTARTLPGTDVALLQAATARANALGIDDQVVLVTRDPKEMMAFLGLGLEEDACATSS